jgi:hypothetical protein
MIKNKKGFGWLGWILLILVVAALGIGVYWWLTAIPVPPAFPN